MRTISRTSVRANPATTDGGAGSAALLLLSHLRIPFQLLLAPIFLLGALSSRRPPAWSWIAPFVAVHVGLYGGATAYNSYYDQDRGPIGFWKRPRPATRSVRDLALALQILSVALLAARALALGAVALAMLLMGIAYSHPRLRWKASTWGGLLAVALGQGIGGVLLGYYAAGGGGLPAAGTLVLALGAALTTMGLYPVTQVYQIDEDRARGDRTVPVRYGWKASLWLSGLATTLGVWTLVLAMHAALARPWPLILAATPVPLAFTFFLWARRFDRQNAFHNHDWAMAIGTAASLLFWIFLAATLARTPGGS